MEFINSLLYATGLSGFFASRAFLPAFAAAFAMKYGHLVPWLGSIEFVQKMADAPTWFTHPAVVWGLGALAVAEMLAERSPEIRELLDEGLVYAKTGLSAATSYGLLSAADAEVVGDLVSQAGFLDSIPAAISGGLTFFLTMTRNGVVGILSEADEDDSLGMRKFISWCEEIWATFGVWVLLAIPAAVLLLNGIVFGVLYLIRKRHEGKMEAARIECPKCQTKIHCFATACLSCDTPNENPVALGFLGGMLEEKQRDVMAQKVRLIELKRSPKSGEKVKGRGADITCQEDSVAVFGDKEVNEQYFKTVDARLPKVLIVSAALGFVPILGLIAGVIYYRLQLVAPYRRYLPWSKGFLTKWLVRLVLLLLAALQIVGFGIFAVPLMALINHWMYRNAFRSGLKKKGLI
ncbi:hypothetical protein IEN85_20220 [Pelagicoccus sp. NFK12]|uniref:DUF4126 domain-containing protein n=1 Tax=Pelagicoccus enzymogenes TaxID=2773457 RepID=A0A927FB39_9BACT|nr:hypothetical protein [Pelagicoccus enzymogenes]MBD5781838.1 hypothetical protein [Pelagicoccus enzymogenes]